jgi:hypothetical protein
MNRFLKVTVLILITFLGFNINKSYAAIEVYPGPGVNTYQSNLYTVEVYDGVNWQPSYTYKYSRKSVTYWGYNTFPSVNFTTFGSDGATSTMVRISKIGGNISSINISPKSKKISATISNGKAIFNTNINDKLWITVDGNDTNPLFIFADSLKPAIPTGSNVLYFGPGITSANHIKATSSQIIYIDGGAWVRGNIDLRGTKNVQVMGPGILSGDLWTSEVVQTLSSTEQKDYVMFIGDWNGRNNATVSGVTIVASPYYNFFNGASNVNGVKILSPWYYSTDGFQAVNHVDQVFVFNGDNVFFPIWSGINGDNVTVTNSFAGNTNNAVFCGGFWGNPNTSTSTSYASNIDIKTYGNPIGWGQFTPAVFQIWVDNATSTKGYSNQTYENIRIEGNLLEPLGQIKNMVYPWSGPNVFDPALGNSYNLVFRNITLEGTQATTTEIKGLDANNGFHNVVLDNIVINSKQVTNNNYTNYFDVNSYVQGFTITAPVDTVAPTVSITSPTNNSLVTRNSNVTITANAFDQYSVSKVEFYVNGVLKCTDTTSPYSCVWLVPNSKNVQYNLSAKAYDTSNNSTVSVNVKVTSR